MYMCTLTLLKLPPNEARKHDRTLYTRIISINIKSCTKHSLSKLANQGRRQFALLLFVRAYRPAWQQATRARVGGSSGLLSASDWAARIVRPSRQDRQQGDGMSEAARNHFAQIPLTHSGVPVDSGAFSPPDASRFSQLTDSLEPRVLEGLARMGVDEMTPVQRGAVPVGLAGFDATVQAETGSGKTLAYLVPMVSRLAANYPSEAIELVRQSERRTQYPSGLVLCPTRELAQQILAELQRLIGFTPIRAGLLVGGLNADTMRDRILNEGAHIAVATPGRLLDFLQRGILSLSACRQLILDEADRCLDMGFERDIRRIITSQEFGPPPASGRQTSLFSATFPPDVARIVRNLLRPDARISVLAGHGAESGPVPAGIRQQLLLLDGAGEATRLDSLRRLLAELGDDERCLVFVQTKLGASQLLRRLETGGVAAVALHGDMRQMTRQMSLESFKSGRSRVLVATDVAARGLDLPGVSLVVNFDAPQYIDQYIHRVGRTGRLGRPGRAVTFLTNRDLASKDIRRDLQQVLRACNQEVPEFLTRSPAIARSDEFGDAEDDDSESSRSSSRSGALPNFKQAVWRSSGPPRPHRQQQHHGHVRRTRF